MERKENKDEEDNSKYGVYETETYGECNVGLPPTIIVSRVLLVNADYYRRNWYYNCSKANGFPERTLADAHKRLIPGC